MRRELLLSFRKEMFWCKIHNTEVYTNYDKNQAIRFIQFFDNHPDKLDWDYQTVMLMIQCLQIQEIIWSWVDRFTENSLVSFCIYINASI